MITIKIKNGNPFNAGWLAAHLGLPRDVFMLDGIDKQAWDEGWDMRQETGWTIAPRKEDSFWHGAAHIGFLYQTHIPSPAESVLHRITVVEGEG